MLPSAWSGGDVIRASPDGEEVLVIGIRNEAGELYRLIGATKHNSFTNAVEELMDLDLVDELEDADNPQDGCDAIFRAE